MVVFSQKSYLIFLIRITKLFGLCSFQYPHDSYKLSKFGVFMIFVNFAMEIGYIYYNFISNDIIEAAAMIEKENIMVRHLMLFVFLFSLLCKQMKMMTNFILRRRIFQLMKKIEFLNEKVKFAHVI